ncbi:MAG: choice-of-anchor D domain-containing protein, partial [Bdellovibrionaceae bacterium]|nr:choice-of-anchor D domain-containing protein [Pseudobdellovibrionaceae bacterium]
MKTGISLILFLFSISVFALPPFDPGDGADSSGGGIAVVCRNPDQTITSVEMLDLYEGRVIYGLNIQAPGKTVPDSLKVIKDKLKVVFKNVPMGKTPAYYIDKAQKDFKLLPPDAALVPVNDGAELVIPTNCTLEQLALYKNNTYLLVNSVLWNQMDDLNKAALFAHEGIYTHERELGDKTSQRSRKIVAHLFSEYDFTSLLSEVPQDANECIAHHEQDLQLIAFQFYKFTNPFQKDEEVLQFTKFRGRYPYSLTDVRTPTWPWADQLGDLYLDVDSPIELFDQLYIRRKMTSSGDVQSYYFQEPDGNYLIKCNKSPQVGEAKLTFNPSSVQFGSVAVGQTGSTSVEITNDGDLAASSISPSDLAEPFSFLGGSYPGTGGTCMATLSAHQKCTIVLAYAPKAMSMSDTTELEFSYNNGTSAAKVHLSLQGAHLAPAVLVISDALNYDYGTQAVGGSTSHVFTVINTGSYQARQMSGGGLASPFSFLGGSYPGTGGTCGSSLNVAAACTVVVAFEPTASGVMSDVLEIGYNDGATKQVSQRQVQGTGANPAVISISDGPAYDFGLVSNSGVVHHTFTLTNSGSISATALSEVGLASPFSMVGGV